MNTIQDKWGNSVLDNGLRAKGELFFDENAPKILAPSEVINQFTDYVKYPRTLHLPWSAGIQNDDRVMSNLAAFVGARVIVTEKMDGENTSLYRDHFHARSIDSQHHPSRNWCKNFWAQMAHNIPEGWRVCGENLYAKHSIAYQALESFFNGFSVFNEYNKCLSWDDTVEWFELLGIQPVPILYDGIFEEDVIQSLYKPTHDWHQCEGYVVRIADGFPYTAFNRSVAKYVRVAHVQTTKHWRHGQEVVPNKLKFSTAN